MAQPASSPQPLSEPKKNASNLHGILRSQREATLAGVFPGLTARCEQLSGLRRVLVARKQEMVDAAARDFGRRAAEETLLLEVFPLLNELKHASKSVENWMQPSLESVAWQFAPGEARVVFQPLGTVGILGAWNYPFYVVFSPLISAIAAGNRVLVKPSELAPACAELIATIVSEAFPQGEVQVVHGDAQVAQDFASLPLDHLLFTGSGRVGKLVMKAAAENLTPVTLELGGKCPAIVYESYNLKRAAERIWTGKLYNAGQTCLAPDYALVPAAKVDEFVELSRATVAKMYPGLAENPDYTKIINERQYGRLMDLLLDAMDRGASCVPLTEDAELPGSRILAPIAVTGATDEMALMQEEIFGPILPVVPYESLDDAIRYVQTRPRPLALYYFDTDSSRIERVLQETVSGGVTINDVILHIGQASLPFGGVGPSGMGRYHGEAGFRTFSNAKAVFRQSRFPLTRLLRPPYGKIARWLAQFLTRG